MYHETKDDHGVEARQTLILGNLVGSAQMHHLPLAVDIIIYYIAQEHSFTTLNYQSVYQSAATSWYIAQW